MKKTTLTAIGLVALMGMTAPAALAGDAAPAATADETYQARISYNPGQSAAQIYAQLKRSIRYACQGLYIKNSTTSLDRRHRIKTDCQHQYMDAAVRKINRPELTALHFQTRPAQVRMLARQDTGE